MASVLLRRKQLGTTVIANPAHVHGRRRPLQAVALGMNADRDLRDFHVSVQREFGNPHSLAPPSSGASGAKWEMSKTVLLTAHVSGLIRQEVMTNMSMKQRDLLILSRLGPGQNCC